MKDLDHIIDFWIKELERYTIIELQLKPSPHSWSLGQLYIHLLNDTNYYIEQIKICVSTSHNSAEEMAPAAKTMLLNNEFPDAIIEGAPSNAQIPQPENKEQLHIGLVRLKEEAKEVERLISQTPYRGKTEHPGLQYFNAGEWYRFAGMHFRHHLRQKKRIDDFLKSAEAQ
ncbi:MAG: DinB family protein [Bacteroidota bacterium]